MAEADINLLAPAWWLVDVLFASYLLMWTCAALAELAPRVRCRRGKV